FKKLVVEMDPPQLAVMAQTLPEPPSFDASVPWQPSAAPAEQFGGTPFVRRRGTTLAHAADPSASADAAPDGEAAMAAMAAIEAAHQAAEANDAGTTTTDPESAAAGETDEADPRLTALGLSSNFDAAEAE